MTEQGDYDVKTKDLRQRFAIFARKPLPDDYHSVLQLAKKLCRDDYGEGFIGDKVWLRIVSGADHYDYDIREWAFDLADYAGQCKGISGRKWMKRYNSNWGWQAACDGVKLAVEGKTPQSVESRATQFEIHRDAYALCRNFIYGVLMVQHMKFEEALYESYRIHRL